MSEDLRPAPENPEGRGIDRSLITDSAQQAFEPEPIVWGPDAEGLPTPELRQRLPLAPALSPDTFICMEDASEFVLRARDFGGVVGRFAPEEVTRAPNGEHYVTFGQAILSGAPWLDVLSKTRWPSGRVVVEPVRPKCQYLSQQLVDFGDQVDAVLVERLCTARRDDERFFVGLRDTRMYACELRSPRHIEGEDRIRKLDETKIELGKQRTAELKDDFDVDAALKRAHAQARDEGLTLSSIFKEGK
jgi:hypothetical protein